MGAVRWNTDRGRKWWDGRCPLEHGWLGVVGLQSAEVQQEAENGRLALQHPLPTTWTRTDVTARQTYV